MKEHPRSDSTVFVIDGDAAVRTVLKELFESVGLKVQPFSSGNAFLEAPVMDTPCCLVLDVRLPGMSGLKLQEELTKAEVKVPIIFLTAHADIHMAVTAMKAGAVDFLTKPFRNQDVLDAVYAALELDGTRRKKSNQVQRCASASSRSAHASETWSSGLPPANSTSRSPPNWA